MEHDYLGLPNGKFPAATEHLKRQSCFSGWNTPKGNSCSISSKLFKAIFDTSFRPSRPFSGKWNSFLQMVNAIPGRNLPALNQGRIQCEMICRFLIQLVFCKKKQTKKKTMWFIGVKVEQETRPPSPKKKSWIRPSELCELFTQTVNRPVCPCK